MAEVVIVDSAAAGGRFIADQLIDAVIAKPDLVLGLATGSTPLTTYQALAADAASRGVPLGGLGGFALDEYVGLPVGHPESYRAVIDREVVEALGLDRSRVHVPGDDAEDGVRFEERIRDAGGVDVQLLGIGTTGHIGFNEPGSPMDSRTRVVELTHQTRVDNARFFTSIDEVPTHALTQGIGTILEAHKLVLIAFGAKKAPAIAKSLEGPVSSDVPGSAVQLHSNTVVVIDEAAASALEHPERCRMLRAS